MALSGEFFDLTITSNNNKFGQEKIKYARQFGISTPLIKYIEELEEIIKTSNDDKTSKRITRLEFLKFCNKYIEFQQYFKIMCNYLNGNDGISDDQFPSYLIITVAGGNVITIFAKLLLELDKIFSSSEPQFETFFNLNIYKSNNGKEFLLKVYNILKTFNDESKKFLLLLASKEYSDFDYNLLPNFHPENDDTPTRIPEGLADDDPQAGFVLFRVKSSIICGSKLDKPEEGASNCKDLLGSKDLQNLYPQGVQQKILEQIPLGPPGSKEQKCKEYIEFLLKKKQIIEQQTKFNISAAILSYMNGIIKNVQHKDGSIKQQVFLNPHHNPINAIIEYIHNVTYNINFYINIWEKGKIKCSLGGVRSDNYFDSLNSFSSLNTILQSRVIMRLGADIVNQFLNCPSFFSEEILDKRLEMARTTDPSCRMFPSKLTIVPNKKEIYKSVKIVGNLLRSTQYSELGFPDGINITINAVATEKIDSNLSIISGPKGEEHEDILKKLQDLLLDDHSPNVEEIDLKPNINACRARANFPDLPQCTSMGSNPECGTVSCSYSKVGGKKYKKNKNLKTKKNKLSKTKKLKMKNKYKKNAKSKQKRSKFYSKKKH